MLVTVLVVVMCSRLLFSSQLWNYFVLVCVITFQILELYRSTAALDSKGGSIKKKNDIVPFTYEGNRWSLAIVLFCAAKAEGYERIINSKVDMMSRPGRGIL